MTEQTEQPGDQTGNMGTDSRAAAQVPDDEIRDASEPAPVPAQQASVATDPAAAEPRDRIDQAAELADQVDPDVGSNRLLVPRRFTVEVGVGGDPERVVTTRVVHLETREEDAWPGWSGPRLLDFFQRRIGVTDMQRDTGAEPVALEHSLGTPAEAPAAESSHAAVELACGGSAVALLTPADSPPQPALAVHRFGLLTAGQPVIRRGGISARLRLDPSELDLPAGHAAVVRAELYAEPVGPGRAEVLDTRTIDLAAVRTVELRGRLPDRDPPFTVFAVVRILVETPAGRPAEGLGTATLEFAADKGG